MLPKLWPLLLECWSISSRLIFSLAESVLVRPQKNITFIHCPALETWNDVMGKGLARHSPFQGCFAGVIIIFQVVPQEDPTIFITSNMTLCISLHWEEKAPDRQVLSPYRSDFLQEAGKETNRLAPYTVLWNHTNSFYRGLSRITTSDALMLKYLSAIL